MADLDVKDVATFIAVLGILVVVLALFFSVAVDLAGDQSTEVDYPTEDQTEALGQNFRIDDRSTASLTLGNGIELDGTDSVSGVAGDENLTQGSFSIAVSARVNTNDPAHDDVNRTIVSRDNGSAALYYNGSHFVGYYDNGSANESVAIAADSEDQYNQLVFRVNDTHVRLDNETLSATADLDQTDDTTPILFDWLGSLDELRTFNSSLTDSETSSYISAPAEPLPGTNRTARYLFDQQGGGDVFVYFANETVDLNGADSTDGVAGPGLDRGTDFEAADDPARIKVLSGGTADGAPVVFVDSPAGAFGGVLQTIGNIGSAAFSLIALTALIMAAARVTGVMDGF